MRLRAGCPVVWRDPSTLQLGIADPLVLENLSPEAMEFIASLEDAPLPVSKKQARRFAQELKRVKDHGLIVSKCARDPSEIVACIHGAGQLGMDIATALILHGIHHLAMVDDEPARTENLHAYSLNVPAARRGPAAAWTLRERFPHTRVTSSRRDPHIDVFVAVGALGPEVAHDMMVAGQPHIAVTTDECGVTVGPVVRPGITPCSRCHALHIAESDPWWPRTLLQLGSPRRPHVDAPASLHAGAVTARVIDQWRQGFTVEPQYVRIDSGLKARSVATATAATAHPECGCGAPSPPPLALPSMHPGLTVIDGDG